MEYLSSIYSLDNNVDGDFLDIQEHLSSPSSSSQSPPHHPLSKSSSSYSPMSNGSHESEFVPFTLEDLKIESSMDGANGAQYMMKPYLRITEQPVEKFRFRYKSEMHGTHGALMGSSSSKTRKSFPTVELANYTGDAIIQCSLYQADTNGQKMHHSHKLVIRQDNVDIDDPHRLNVNQFRGYSVQYKGMGIIHTAKKYIADELYRKLKAQEQSRGVELSYRQEMQLKEKAERESKSMNLNQVCLCFQAMVENPNGTGLYPICEPVYSRCINNLKSALTGELKICRLSTAVSSAAGQDELFMFVEKVGKKNIKVKFYELDENGDEIWCDWGNFTEIDVHHQYAIALTTPPYRNVDISSPVDIFIQLYRPSDDDCSEPMPFKYKPRDNMMNPRKRQRVATSFPSSEIPLVLERMSNATTSMMPPRTTEELNKMQIINDFIPSTDDYAFSGISSADLTDLQLLTCDGNKSGSDSEEVAEQTLQIEEEYEKLAKMYRLYGSNDANHSSMREKILAVMKDYFEKYGQEASFLQDLLGYGDDSRVRQVFQMLNKLSLEDLLREIDPHTNSNLLHTVCARNKAQFIRALAHVGLDPSKQDKDGNSPLHLAVISNSTDCVQALLQLPNLSEVFNNEGYSPIHIAVRARHMPITRLLLQADFNVTSTERRQGNNALHLAVLSKSLMSCEMILEQNKISIDTKNSADFSALEVAKALASDEEGDELKKIIKLLEKNGSEGEKSDPVAEFQNATVTTSAAENKSRQGVETLLNQDKQWKELAHSLGMDHVICVCETSNNPTGTLFNLIEFESVDPQRIRLAISSLKNIEHGHILNVLEKILIR